MTQALAIVPSRRIGKHEQKKMNKLTIDPEGGKPFGVRFNPERYTLNKGVQIAEINIPGLDSPALQFVRGQNEKITLELFFDTTDSGMVEDVKDVREDTKKIYQLLKINRETHAPPRCRLTWGTGGATVFFWIITQIPMHTGKCERGVQSFQPFRRSSQSKVERHLSGV